MWGHQLFSMCPVQCRIGTFMKPKCSIAGRCCYWWSGCTGVSGASSFTEAMKMGTETYHHLKAVIKAKYGQDGQSTTLLSLLVSFCLSVFYLFCVWNLHITMCSKLTISPSWVRTGCGNTASVLRYPCKIKFIHWFSLSLFFLSALFA